MPIRSDQPTTGTCASLIGTHVHGPGAHGRRIEHHDVRVPTGAQHAAFARAEQFRRHLRQLMNGLWQGNRLELTHAVAERLGRERERVDHVRAGIGGADHGAVVGPELATDFPQRFVGADSRRHERGA